MKKYAVNLFTWFFNILVTHYVIKILTSAGMSYNKLNYSANAIAFIFKLFYPEYVGGKSYNRLIKKRWNKNNCK